MMGAVGKFFGMFDKIDDIVYEPVKLFCDALRQPLKQIELKNEKNKEEHELALKKELQQFESDLEFEKKEREMKLTIEQKRMEEDINQMVLDNDLARREKMIQLEAKYRKEMALAAAELEQIILNITTENRDKIFKLYAEHKRQYIDIQNAYTDSVYANVERMKNIFPGEAGQGRIMDFMFTYIEKITEESCAFTNQLNDDMKKVIDIVDSTTNSTSNLATKYLQPIVNNISIENDNKGYIESSENK